MKVGDYARTKNGQFYKITYIKPYYENGNLIKENSAIYIDGRYSGWNYKQFEQLIIGSSPNIIDLIEVGDYINGTIVTKVVLDEIECKYIELDYTYNKRGIREKNIKSIVTKEQFKRMEYEVK